MDSESPSVIAGLAERDVDLLLLEELVVSPAFLRHFLTLGGIQNVDQLVVLSAERAATDSIGESDILLRLLGPSGQHVVLVENKISAAFQPRQAERYRLRGTLAVQGGAVACHSILVAPSTYAGGEPRDFDGRVHYEDLVDWLRRQGDFRSRYRADVLAMALQKGALGYHPILDEPASQFWNCYWLFTTRHAPELGLSKPGSKPAGSTFVYFNGAGLRPGIFLVHKMTHGHVDLEFSGWGSRLGELQVRIGPLLGDDLVIVKAAKSAAIRHAVPRVTLADRFEDQEEAVLQAIQAARRLQALAKNLPDLSSQEA